MLIILLTLIASPAQSQPPSASTSTVSYVYKAGGLRDPFISLLQSAGGLAAGSSRSAPAQGQPQKSPEEVEAAFNPDNLILKAMLTDKSKGGSIALISNPSNPDEEYVVKGSKIRHTSSGLTLQNYSASVGLNTIVIKKTQGDPLVSTITFPKEKEVKP